MWKMYAKSNVKYRNQTYFGAKHLKSLIVFVFLFVFPSGFFKFGQKPQYNYIKMTVKVNKNVLELSLPALRITRHKVHMPAGYF